MTYSINGRRPWPSTMPVRTIGWKSAICHAISSWHLSGDSMDLSQKTQALTPRVLAQANNLNELLLYQKYRQAGIIASWQGRCGSGPGEEQKRTISRLTAPWLFWNRFWHTCRTLCRDHGQSQDIPQRPGWSLLRDRSWSVGTRGCGGRYFCLLLS